jgi:thiol-disulfide isomerase/thioredoxin
VLGPALGARAQTPAAGTAVNIVRDVRVAIDCTAWPCSPKQDFSEAEAILKRYRAANGTTPEALEALSWLGRGALAGQHLDKAFAYAQQAYDESLEALRTRKLEGSLPLENALGAGMEVLAHVRAGRGQRTDAVYFLQRDLETYRGTVLEKRIQKNINLLSLEGQTAPALVATEEIGRPTPRLADLKGKVVLLFFWAHWCPDCKAMSPTLTKLLDKYRAQGLTIIAPTQRYGYTAQRSVAAAPEVERQHIVQVRDAQYAFLRDEAVPLDEANHRRYGVSTTPTLALVDRQGIVRMYRPGQMPEADLETAIQALVRGGTSQ